MKDERVVISGSIDVDDERSRIAGEGRQLAKFAATLLVLEGLASHAGSEERRWHGSLASARSSVATAFMFGVLCTGSGVYALANDLWYGWIGLSVRVVDVAYALREPGLVGTCQADD